MNQVYRLAFPKIKGIGPVYGRQVLDLFDDDLEAFFSASKKELLQIPGITEHTVSSIKDKLLLEEAEKELAFVEKHQIQSLFFTDVDYPTRLLHCPDAPLLLFYKGSVALNQPRVVSIVGTRNATAYGQELCAALVAGLKEYGALVISGLAYGIDSHAHRACLQYGLPTIGVLGHGLDRIYPMQHRRLAMDMLDNGGLLTEYRSNTNPDRQNFPARNRIIAGLADVVVVVEAALKGGALITAEIANGYNRDVCAFPGKVGDAYSAGCNHLIKTHRAHLISGVKDLAYIMNWATAEHVQSAHGQQLAMHLDLNDKEKPIYQLIQQQEKISIDELCLQLQVPQSKISITLLEMEMKGLLVALPGKMYRVP
ncbi:DNA-processing protein DprA [Olivibacter sitiensis]|uniref:DNA-processing protein DprA n=1 Tax=Olivibacter sitiensis TaxID=376470 RepID=UPI0003F7AFAE|nr:DNA-processing protein DprA [Olivibacter sitiensis]